MENKITTFSSEEFGNVRTMMIDGDPWFIAADVCKILGLNQVTNAVKGLDEDEKALITIKGLSRGNDTGNIINEFGLYNLILRSRKPEAKTFRRWITHEVIPAIRKHGMYITNPLLGEIVKDPSILRNMVKNYLAATAQAEMLAAEVENMRPKAEFFDAFVSPTDCTNIRTTAKELQIPERQFCKFLVDARFLFRCPAGNLMPYNKPMNRSLFIVRDYYADNGHKGSYTLITPQGKNMFRMMLCEM